MQSRDVGTSIRFNDHNAPVNRKARTRWPGGAIEIAKINNVPSLEGSGERRANKLKEHRAGEEITKISQPSHREELAELSRREKFVRSIDEAPFPEQIVPDLFYEAADRSN